MASKSVRQRSTTANMQNCEYPRKTIAINGARKRQRKVPSTELGDCLGQEDLNDKKLVGNAGQDTTTFRVPGPRKRRKRSRLSTDAVSPGQPFAKRGHGTIQPVQGETGNEPKTWNGSETGTAGATVDYNLGNKHGGDPKGFQARPEAKNVRESTPIIAKGNSQDKHGVDPVVIQTRSEEQSVKSAGFHQITVPYLNPQDVNFRRTALGLVKIFGEGKYGYVIRGEYKPAGVEDKAGDVVAKYAKSGKSSLGDNHYEARMLAYLSDTGCVPKVHGLLKDETSVEEPAIVQECVGGGLSLEHVLKLRASQSTWVEVCLQLAQGLEKIHGKGVLLNDIKADNILVACSPGGNNIRFIDMGMASYKCGVWFRSASSPHLAPEVRRGGLTSELSDIYSLGKVIESIALKANNALLHAIGQLLTCEDPSKRCSLQTVMELLQEFASRMAQVKSAGGQNNV